MLKGSLSEKQMKVLRAMEHGVCYPVGYFHESTTAALTRRGFVNEGYYVSGKIVCHMVTISHIGLKLLVRIGGAG